VSIDAGTGNDSMELDGAVDFTFAGGAGVDTIIVDTTVDLTTSTFSWSSVEQLDIHGVSDLTILASDISGQSIVLAESSNDGAEDLIVSVDQVVVDLSGVGVAGTWDAADDVTIDASGMGLSMTITGSAATDVITGSSRADAISGGAGTDTIDGNAGADTLTGGAGADVFVFNDGDSGITVATADVITDYTAGTDDIDLAGFVAADVLTDYEEADGSAVTTWAALVALADASLDPSGGGANGEFVYVSYNAMNSGNAYVFFDASGDGSFGAGDTLIVLTGVTTAAGVDSGDFV